MNSPLMQLSQKGWDDPRFAAANILIRDGDFSEAIALYDEILSGCPDHPRALHASGFLRYRTGRIGEALERINKALLLKPDFTDAYVSLGTIYMQTGQISEALKCCRKAIELNPDSLQFNSNYLFCLEGDSAASADKRFHEALLCSKRHFAAIPQRSLFPNLIDPDKPLRIGLVSPDLGIHPVGFFLLPLLEYNNRARYKFICYRVNEKQDSVSEVLKENSLEWRDISCLDDQEACDLIENDRIDILIDLAGHTARNRLLLFARRAAPVQVTWLGYSSTTAVPAMDYLFTDDSAVLPGEERFFTENIYRFAPSRFCYLPVGTVPDVSSPPLLKNHYCTFGSFNNLSKLTPEVIGIWSKILRRTHGSRLIIKSRLTSDDYVRDRYLQLFSENGVSSDRVEFRGFSQHGDMLAEYGDIDIALDPFPFCGGMTSCNSLWMGVPVVTLASERPIGRQTRGFLELAGLNGLVADTREEYIAIASQLASDPERLAGIRSSLREKLSTSSLCDPFAFVRGFEDGLRTIWRNWCNARKSPEKNYPWDDGRFEEAFKLFQSDLGKGTPPKDAYNLYMRLLSDYPDHPRALHAMGVVLHNLGESEDGIACIKRAISLKPDFADAFNNLGNIYNHISMFAEAESCFRHYVAMRPDSHVALNNLARVLLENGKREEALSVGFKAIDLSPDYVDGLITIGNILIASGEAVKAFEFTRQANRLAPRNANIHTNLLYTMNFIPGVRQEEIYKESLKWGRRHADSKYSRRPHFNAPNPDKKLRIGYVSGDFKLHPVGYHFKPVLEHHDHSRFEIYLYSTVNKSDTLTESLKKHSDHWRMVASLPDEQLEEMIRVDGIDILVDLSGHTAFNRLGLFALKPSPVQASWIGYCNTTGMKAIDYLISDWITIPADEGRWIAEEVVRLPHGRFCYEPPYDKIDITKLPALENGNITFGSFNKLVKVTDETVCLWCSVLHAVKGSRLVIKSSALNETSAVERINELFRTQGIASHRLDIRYDSPYLEMLEEYGDIDIALDSFPFNGGATTCEALWMGVPVVTLSGNTPISRQSASLLSSCGLSRFVAYTRAEFVAITTELAGDLQELSALRSTMRERLKVSPLFDGTLFTAHLEGSYRKMWYHWCESGKSSNCIKYNAKTSFEEYYNAGIDRMDEDDDESAMKLFKCALRKKPDSAHAYSNLGIALLNLGPEYYKRSAASFRKALRYDPHLGVAHKHLGRVLDEMKDSRLCGEAEDAFITAIRLLPDDPDLHYWLANFKLSLGKTTEALEIYKKAMQIAPDNSKIYDNYIFTMNYVPECSQEDILSESRLWESRYGYKGPVSDFGIARRNTSKLRIGYVSGDFHKHPVGIFFQAAVVNHDSDVCEIFCYFNRKTPRIDEVSTVIKNNVSVMRVVGGMTDAELYDQIVADEIDILVDLSGYTDANRLKVFSRRAAPVQISWLGYYNTTGLSTMDYVITDEMTVPPGFEKWYSENVIRMPHSRFCYTPPYLCPDVELLPALKNHRVTFGSFNNFSKLTESVIETWSRIMALVPKSRIVLKWRHFTEKSIKEHYCSAFERCGIKRNRIEFRDASPPFLMLDEYNDIDIALDPFPFTGGLTSCEALWMGVPVVTFAGDRPAGRQTAGFLKTLGLDELIAENLDDYVDRAVKLSGNVEYLSNMRAGLRQRFADSPLCDGKRFVGNLEKIYKTIWDAHMLSGSRSAIFQGEME